MSEDISSRAVGLILSFLEKYQLDITRKTLEMEASKRYPDLTFTPEETDRFQPQSCSKAMFAAANFLTAMTMLQTGRFDRVRSVVEGARWFPSAAC